LSSKLFIGRKHEYASITKKLDEIDQRLRNGMGILKTKTKREKI